MPRTNSFITFLYAAINQSASGRR